MDHLDTVDMRRQHHAAEEMAASIVALISGYRDEYDAIPILRRLTKLNTLLRVHFAYEDTVLYPALIAGGDRAGALLALKFHVELGPLAMQFEDFARRWSSPTTIASSFDEFREEAAAIFATLGARIERENDLLYPLAERTLSARAA